VASLTIDGNSVTVSPGTTILKASQSIGIDIPNFCYDKDLTVAAACRMCVVEVEGYPNLPAACCTAAVEGMVVHTESDKVVKARRMLLELL